LAPNSQKGRPCVCSRRQSKVLGQRFAICRCILMRKVAARTVPSLFRAVHLFSLLLIAQECANYFSHAVYASVRCSAPCSGFSTVRAGTHSPGRRFPLGEVRRGCLGNWGIERMVFVLKRTPAFQPFGPFQDRSQAQEWIKRHANKRRYACCILEPIHPPPE